MTVSAGTKQRALRRNKSIQIMYRGIGVIKPAESRKDNNILLETYYMYYKYYDVTTI